MTDDVMSMESVGVGLAINVLSEKLMGQGLPFNSVGEGENGNLDTRYPLVLVQIEKR